MKFTTSDSTWFVKDRAVLMCAIPNKQYCLLERWEISDTETLNLFLILSLMLLTTILFLFSEVASGIRISTSKTPIVMPMTRNLSLCPALLSCAGGLGLRV